jgi:nuclear pore complex protein Nup205
MSAPALNLSTWDHSLFEDLQHLLARVASQPTTSLVRRLRQKLDEALPWMLTLTAVPGPSEADKQSLQKGAFISSIKEHIAEYPHSKVQ